MSSVNLPTDLAPLLALYDENRFLDAWEATRDLWRPEVLPHLDLEMLIHGSRLAGRLGGFKLRRHLLRLARSRAPEHPLVRYFAHDAHRSRSLLLDQLRDLESRPHLESGDPSLDASFLAFQAILWASVRQFDRAHTLLSEALANETERAWILGCQATVLLHEGRWTEAAEAAGCGWEISPGLPMVADVLAESLCRLDRRREAVDRLLVVAERKQSFEITVTTCRHLAGLAERSEGDERRELAERAWALAEALETLAPLGDREAGWLISVIRSDIALVLGDRERLLAATTSSAFPFFRRVANHLREHPDGERIEVPHRPVFQKHNTCLPASITTVLGGLGVDVDVEELAAAMTYAGTPLWVASDWLAERGHATRAFIVDRDTALRLLHAGIPFVLLVEFEEDAHAMVIVGVDEGAGLFLIHDPAATRRSAVLMDSFGAEEAPFGPEALAVVPRDRAALLDLIPEEHARPATALLEFRRTLVKEGSEVALRTIATRGRERNASDIHDRRLEALHLSLEGRHAEAIAIQEELLSRFPDCIRLRNELLGNLERTRDTARVREALEEIVERGRIPGTRLGERMLFPPSAYVTRFADYLSLCPQDSARAERLLRSSLRRSPSSAVAYHVLGDILSRRGAWAECVLPYQIAARLDDASDHFAEATASAMRFAGREDDGIREIEARVERIGALREGNNAWMTLVTTLESFGRPDEAIRALERAFVERPDDFTLRAQAVGFWIRMGRWGEAHRSLELAAKGADEPVHARAAVELYSARGEWRTALEFADRWLRAEPESLDARSRFAWLHAHAHGQRATDDLVREWSESRPGDRELEDLRLDRLQAAGDTTGREALLERRVARNPRDAWAWSALATATLERATSQSGASRQELLSRAEDLVRRHAELDPDSSPSFALQAACAEVRGDTGAALALLRSAIESHPEETYLLHRILALVQSLPEDDARLWIVGLRDALLRVTGPLHDARRIVLNLAGTFGIDVAQSVLDAWEASRPEDPELIEARADLWLERGQGRADARRAIELLEPAVVRFPRAFDLRFSLAHAYGIDLREADEERVWREIIARQPTNVSARSNLARLLARTERIDEAVSLLEDATEKCPISVFGWRSLADLLRSIGRHDRAAEVLDSGIARCPEDVALREHAIQHALDIGRDERALAMARDGVKIHPEGAYLWLLLATTSDRGQTRTSVAEIESYYRKALSLHCGLYEAVDGLASLLTRQRRFAEARETLDAYLGLPDAEPSAAGGRRAWVEWEEGRREDAIREMSAVLQRWPLYDWGWSRLLEWIEELEDWDLARQRLESLHPGFAADPSFCARRLEILRRAGVDRSQLDAKWKELMENFPRSEALHLRRADDLLERNDDKEARRVIDAVLRFHPESPWTLARHVQILARANEREEAIATSLRIWRIPGDENWPDEVTWAALRRADLDAEAARRAYEFTLAGDRIRPRALELLLHAILTGPAFPAWNRKGVLSDLARALLKDPEHRAEDARAVLEALQNAGGTETVLWIARDRADAFLEYTPLWQAKACALASLPGKHRELRAWMADWRERSQVQMESIFYYLRSLQPKGASLLSRRGDVEEILASSREALHVLRHDHAVRSLAVSACGAALWLGRNEEFLDLFQTYRNLIVTESAEQFRPPGAWPLPETLPLFARLLASESPEETLALSRELASVPHATACGWIRRTWLARTRERLSSGDQLRVWLRLGVRSLRWWLMSRERRSDYL